MPGSMRPPMFKDIGLRVLLVLASRRESRVTNSAIPAAFTISDTRLIKVAHALARTDGVERALADLVRRSPALNRLPL